jgi:hypothetical protein
MAVEFGRHRSPRRNLQKITTTRGGDMFLLRTIARDWRSAWALGPTCQRPCVMKQPAWPVPGRPTKGTHPIVSGRQGKQGWGKWAMRSVALGRDRDVGPKWRPNYIWSFFLFYFSNLNLIQALNFKFRKYFRLGFQHVFAEVFHLSLLYLFKFLNYLVNERNIPLVLSHMRNLIVIIYLNHMF